MRAWLSDMSADLVAGLLTVLVAVLAGRRFWDRRVAGAVQTYVEEYYGSALDPDLGTDLDTGTAAEQAPGVPADPRRPGTRRLHVRNGSNEMIFDPRVTFWGEEAGPRSEPFRDGEGRPITFLLPGQSWSEAEWHVTDPVQPVVISFKTGRNRAHVKGVAAYERASPWKLLVNLGAFLLLTLLFGGLSRLLLRLVAGVRALRWWALAVPAVAAVAGAGWWLAVR
jgi:hypothetical protein